VLGELKDRLCLQPRPISNDNCLRLQYGTLVLALDVSSLQRARYVDAKVLERLGRPTACPPGAPRKQHSYSLALCTLMLTTTRASIHPFSTTNTRGKPYLNMPASYAGASPPGSHCRSSVHLGREVQCVCTRGQDRLAEPCLRFCCNLHCRSAGGTSSGAVVPTTQSAYYRTHAALRVMHSHLPVMSQQTPS
jgi:hypothetical protein